MPTKNRNNGLILLSKVIFIILIFYYGWFQIVFFQIPNMLLILGIGLMIPIILHLVKFNTPVKQGLTTELNLWIAFGITSLFLGYFVATNKIIFVNSILTFFEYLLVIYAIIYISRVDNNESFFIKTIFVYCIVCAATTILAGVELRSGRVTMGILNNPNSLGILMTIGVFTALYLIDFQKLWNVITQLFLVGCFLYVIILSGSRKSFLAGILLLLYWVSFVLYKKLKHEKTSKKIMIISLLFLGISLLYGIMVPFFEDSILFSRLDVLLQGGDQTRKMMYMEAFDFFKQSPIVGVGYKQFEVISVFRTYSHSTYAETLACTGLVGTILYFSPFVLLLRKFIKDIREKKGDYIRVQQSSLWLGMLGVITFLGIGIIHYYELDVTIVLGIMLAYCNKRAGKGAIHEGLYNTKTIHS